MRKERFIYLFEAYYSKTCTPAERSELMQAIKKGDKEEWLREALSAAMDTHVTDKELDPTAASDLYATIRRRIMDDQPLMPVHKRTINWKRIVAAASVLIIITVSAYLFLSKPGHKADADTHTSITNDIPPGNNKATLRLADGTVIELDNATTGSLAQEGNTKITKLDSGLISYNVTSYETIKSTQYNEVLTPRGGQFTIMLPDGSKVWLNAASSLKFPVAFTGNERLVTLTGEAYFEVAHNKQQPFKVIADGATVEALGTQFNVNAYADEPALNTTLVEGKVKVSFGKEVKILKPGEAASVAPGANIVTNINADVETAIAWKEGVFKLTMADLQTVMRQVARWYDVEVVYDNGVPSGHIIGTVSRDMSLSNMLKLLAVSGIRCRLQNRVLTVYNK